MTVHERPSGRNFEEFEARPERGVVALGGE